MKIDLNKDQSFYLATMLDTELRHPTITEEYATELNEIYKQLVGHDHDHAPETTT